MAHFFLQVEKKLFAIAIVALIQTPDLCRLVFEDYVLIGYAWNRLEPIAMRWNDQKTSQAVPLIPDYSPNTLLKEEAIA